jgi:zinc protease
VFALALVAAALALAAPTRAAEAAPTKVTTVEGISEYKLANGLRVLLFPDDSKPLVTVNLTVFVGSRHEGYGETGMAHLLEHMLFKGTPTFPDVPKALRDHGYRGDANTWVDRTVYFGTMPASDKNLEFAIKLEADRMVNSLIRREDLLSEMTVVRNEFEAGENNPEGVLLKRMLSAAYLWHNYGKTTIGNRSDIERVPIERLRAFYKKYYRPDNAMLVVAGKFDQKKALAHAGKYFGPLKNPAAALPATYTEEPAQDGERKVTLRRVGSLGAVGAVYHMPAAAHPDYAAVAVLGDVLTIDPDGRLYKALVKTKLAGSVSSATYPWHDPGVLAVLASAEPTKVDAARKAMTDTLENLAKEPVTAEEVSRSRVRYQMSFERLLASSDELAVSLGQWAACGDWRLYFLTRDRIAKVTAADVNRVAAKYLVRSNRTVGTFIPTKAPQRAAVPATPDVAALVKEYKGGADLARGEAFEPTPENVEKRVRRGVLAGGVKTAFLAKKTRGELVHLRLNLHFGNEKSLAGKTTAAVFLGALMRQGTAKYTRKQLLDELDRLGAQLGVSSSAGELQLTLQVKKENLAAALKLVEEVLRRPNFPADELELLKRERLDGLEKGKTDPGALALSALVRTLSPFAKDDVRYEPTIEEAIDRVKAVTVEQVKELYAKQLGATAGELAVVGDFDPAAAESALADILNGWKAATPYRRITHTVPANVRGGVQTIRTPDKENAVYVAGLAFAVAEGDPDWPALQVGNYLLGAAPLSSRLSTRVRVKGGLSYAVGSQVNASSTDKVGMFLVFAIANPANVAKVEAAIKQELEKFLKEGPGAEELREGTKAYLENLKANWSDDATLARYLADDLFLGRTGKFDIEKERKIRALDPAAVKEAFKKHVSPAKLVIVKAGDFARK